MSDETPSRLRDDLLSLADFAAQRLTARLDGLTDDEYRWEPAPGCWSVRPGPDGRYRMDGGQDDPPPLTTIAWRICHVIDLLAAERNATWLGVRPLRTVRDVDRDGEPDAAGPALAQLDAAWRLFRDHVAAVDPPTLLAPMGRVAGYFARDTRTAFILHELDEFIHHGAEIALLRDLYRSVSTRPGAGMQDL